MLLEERSGSLSTVACIFIYVLAELDMPVFAHLPLILKPDGNGKLSKRDGDRRVPVSSDWYSKEQSEVFSGYREQGFIEDAFINMLAVN